MKKQSFITGAIILMAANAISKILGAVFKIPLTYILKEEGMAVYNIAFEVYIMFLAFIISGLPLAVSKLVAEANSRREFGTVRKTVTVSAVLLSLIGIVGSILLYIGAPFFAIAMNEEKAIWAIKMISPSIFFVALGTAYKSYYQGVSNMIPTAVSQVIEAVIKLAAGYYLAIMFMNMGTEKAAAGAITGVTAGEIVATAILIFMYLPQMCKHKDKVYIKSDINHSIPHTKTILKDLMSIAVPMLCFSVVSNALNAADTTLVRSRLLDCGFSAEKARFLYGAYSGYALTVFHLPIGILATLGVSILPLIAGATVTKNTETARKTADIGIRLTMLLSLPCSVIMCTMSREILSVLFGNTHSASMLSIVAPCAMIMCVAQIAGSVLQAAGKITLPFFTALAGSAVKIALSYFLVGNPKINIYGSAISANAAYFVIMILNLIAVRKYLGLKQDITAILIKPMSAAAAMVMSIYLLRGVFRGVSNELLFLALVCVMSAAVYTLMLFLTNAVSVREVRKILVKKTVK